MSDMFERLSNLSPKRLALLAMELQDRLDVAETAGTEPIAIVGMGCRFPGAENPEAYWRLLADGVDAIREIPASRWDVDDYYDPDPDAPGKIATRWAATLDDIDLFEPQLFGIAQREAQTMDPQQRLLLEVAWESLEDAGIAPDSVHGTDTGVYVGVCNSDYAQLLMEGDEQSFDMYLSTGNAGSVASGRLSYVLGLQGPAMTVDTACSSSLVAIHLAVQAVRSGSCRMALAGGVNVILSPKTTMTLSRARMMAADGRCKSFDARADGFVRGEGCGLVVLKRLSDALDDGDRVLAVIRGSAVNQDGRSNGLTAPNGPSQVAVIRAALADAGIEPNEVGYVETHGTGTALGDPIEAQALGAALGPGRDPSNRLMIGSAKSNLGHLESAAGVAGLIKLVLSLQHDEVPPLLHLHEPNPYIPWTELPIDVPTVRTSWPPSAGSRIGGVSSFGFSGTNAHMLVEAAPRMAEMSAPDAARTHHLIALSARTDVSLERLAERLGGVLVGSDERSIVDVARTLNVGRSDLAHRLCVVASDVEELASALTAWATGDPTDTVSTGVAHRAPEVGFLFTGHGSQYLDMGRGLYDASNVFRDAIDRCAELFSAEVDRPLTTVMFDAAESEALLANMAFAQPAVFAVEYALAELWRSWGVTPTIVAGHSVGEYVAAVVAGVMSLGDGVRLVAARGRLMASLPPDGEMATVFASEVQVQAVLDSTSGGVSIAAVNGPESVALSGTGGRLQGVLDALGADGIEVRRLAIPVAAHSAQVDPILDEFEAVAATVQFTAPRIDVVSGMTGCLASGTDLVTATYWRDHLRQPVRFADAFQSIHDRGVRRFVEVGPHPTLLNMARHIVPEHECAWLPSLRSGHDDWHQILASAGRLYVDGVALDWHAVDARNGKVVSLPTYPFERERHWADAVRRRRSHVPAGAHPLLGAEVRSPALQGVVFESKLSANWPAFLDDHRIYGTALLPSPAYLEMALAAASPTAVTAGYGVASFEIREGLILSDDGERIVQVVVHDAVGADDAGRDVDVVSRHPGSEEWTLHATGRLVSFEATRGLALDLDAVRTRCTDRLEGEGYYDRLADLGLEFGPAFRGATDIWRRDGEALGRIELPASLVDETRRFAMHPALLDACFHVLGASMVGSDDQAYLLIGIDEFRVHERPTCAVWSHVVLHPGFERPGSVFSGDVRIHADDGTLVAEALGVHLRAASRDALMRVSRRPAADWLYDVEWRPGDVSGDVGSADREESDERWMIVGGGDGLAESLASALASMSIDAVRVVSGDGDGLAAAIGASAGRCRIVHLSGPDAIDDVAAATIAALTTAQSVLDVDRLSDLWFVTRGAQPAGSTRVDLAQAPLWGLGRVIAVEHPEHWGGLVDLAPLDGTPCDRTAEARALVDAIRSASVDDQMALRDGQWLVPRLVRSSLADGGTPIEWRDDHSYLVTGGLGGLGLRLAQWMAAGGAGTVVLTGRTGLPSRAEWDAVATGSRVEQQIAAIRSAEALGTTVVVAEVDVADAEAMGVLVGRFGSDLPPLAGVVHAAAALGSASTTALSPDDVETMFRPKVTGTLVLHELTEHIPLDFFVMFSSTSALWGSRELGHYAAANQFLDAMAHHRHSLGLPALAVDWGTWDEMRVASADEQAEVAGTGMYPMPSEDALAVLAEAIARREVVQIAVASVDWSVLKPVYEARRERPFLAEVAAPRSATGRRVRQDAPPELVVRLADVVGEARRDLVVEFLREEVARALGITDRHSVDIEQGLFEMGMDSLMSVELKNRIEVAVGANLPSTLTFNYPNIAALADYVVTHVLPDEILADDLWTTGSGSPRGDTPSATDDLSEDELAAMLASRLSKLN